MEEEDQDEKEEEEEEKEDEDDKDKDEPDQIPEEFVFEAEVSKCAMISLRSSSVSRMHHSFYAQSSCASCAV
jgi:hypothetical protein